MGRLKKGSGRLQAAAGGRVTVVAPEKTAVRRLRGRAWMALRDKVFLRDGYQCVTCGRVVAPSDAECDHVIALADGGCDELGNLQTMCKECHAEKSTAENRARNRRW